MSEHYGTAVIPARIRKPKDKPSAEGTVGIISTWIIAALRHQKFFSLTYIKHKVDVRITRNVIEIFYNNNRICSRPKLHGREGQYNTVEDHMPEDHKKN
ncbi:hypothetical protein [Clostridium sp.]|uniref:hypothetical protein n=1 Tax=Clostridium sp. TaxID=1506 RepID=UPI003D6D8914